MVVEAAVQLDDRVNGTSLQAIRKFMMATYDIKKQHIASFNSLTLKAAITAVATGELERVNRSHSFRITADMRQKDSIRNYGL